MQLPTTPPFFKCCITCLIFVQLLIFFTKHILTDEGYVSPVLPRVILPPQLFLLRQLLLPKLLGHQFHPPILVDLQGSNKPHSPLKSINFPPPMATIFILISTYICVVLILVVRDTGASFTLGRKYLQNFGMDGNIPAKNYIWKFKFTNTSCLSEPLCHG